MRGARRTSTVRRPRIVRTNHGLRRGRPGPALLRPPGAGGGGPAGAGLPRPPTVSCAPTPPLCGPGGRRAAGAGGARGCLPASRRPEPPARRRPTRTWVCGGGEGLTAAGRGRLLPRVGGAPALAAAATAGAPALAAAAATAGAPPTRGGGGGGGLAVGSDTDGGLKYTLVLPVCPACGALRQQGGERTEEKRTKKKKIGGAGEGRRGWVRVRGAETLGGPPRPHIHPHAHTGRRCGGKSGHGRRPPAPRPLHPPTLPRRPRLPQARPRGS